MAFSNQLAKAGFPPDSVKTTAKVHIDKGEAGFSITKVELVTRAKVPGVDEKTFREKAEAAKTGCPVSKALQAVTITLDARLEA
jgi:osmotically inducible protein OsmC